MDRFWAKVDKSSDCWNWTAAKFWHGYGCFGVKQTGGKYKTSYAHRVAWELVHGDIAEGMFVLHKCDNRACVNPSHLFLGTQKDNMADCSMKGRSRTKPRYGSENPYAKLTEAHVKIIRYIGNRLSQQHLADALGVTQSNVGHVLRGNTWKHVRIAA